MHPGDDAAGQGGRVALLAADQGHVADAALARPVGDDAGVHRAEVFGVGRDGVGRRVDAPGGAGSGGPSRRGSAPSGRRRRTPRPGRRRTGAGPGRRGGSGRAAWRGSSFGLGSVDHGLGRASVPARPMPGPVLLGRDERVIRLRSHRLGDRFIIRQSRRRSPHRSSLPFARIPSKEPAPCVSGAHRGRSGAVLGTLVVLAAAVLVAPSKASAGCSHDAVSGKSHGVDPRRPSIAFNSPPPRLVPREAVRRPRPARAGRSRRDVAGRRSARSRAERWGCLLAAARLADESDAASVAPGRCPGRLAATLRRSGSIARPAPRPVPAPEVARAFAARPPIGAVFLDGRPGDGWPHGRRRDARPDPPVDVPIQASCRDRSLRTGGARPSRPVGPTSLTFSSGSDTRGSSCAARVPASP